MPRVLMLARTSLAIVAFVAITGCSSPAVTAEPSVAPTPAASAPESDAPMVDAVSIKGFAFTPDDLTVPAGTTVTWTNEEDSLHTVTSGTPATPSGLFDSGEIDTGVAFTYTFADAGTYPFFCARHDFMTGVVTVSP
jgi:plastocyanin